MAFRDYDGLPIDDIDAIEAKELVESYLDGSLEKDYPNVSEAIDLILQQTHCPECDC